MVILSESARPLRLRSDLVHIAEASDRDEWDRFVHSHAEATAYHLWSWRHVFEKAFGHQSIYLTARRGGRLVGILPLVRFHSWLFGSFLASLPFVNYGGVLAQDEVASSSLLQKAAQMAGDLGVSHIEFRHRRRVFPMLTERQHKVGMLLPLPVDGELMWQRLDRKVRNQIRKAEKSGLTAEAGGVDLLQDFYEVFARNMRDLGTPVYSRRFFAEMFAAFPDRLRICAVRSGSQTVAAGISLRYRDVLEVPWASSLRTHRALCPNHLLYWTLITGGIRENCSLFDFGRSTRNEGTFQFKRQWGAEPISLHWEYHLEGGGSVPDHGPGNPRFRSAIAVWKRLPLALTMRLGPLIVRSIP